MLINNPINFLYKICGIGHMVTLPTLIPAALFIGILAYFLHKVYVQLQTHSSWNKLFQFTMKEGVKDTPKLIKLAAILVGGVTLSAHLMPVLNILLFAGWGVYNIVELYSLLTNESQDDANKDELAERKLKIFLLSISLPLFIALISLPILINAGFLSMFFAPFALLSLVGIVSIELYLKKDILIAIKDTLVWSATVGFSTTAQNIEDKLKSFCHKLKKLFTDWIKNASDNKAVFFEDTTTGLATFLGISLFITPFAAPALTLGAAAALSYLGLAAFGYTLLNINRLDKIWLNVRQALKKADQETSTITEEMFTHPKATDSKTNTTDDTLNDQNPTTTLTTPTTQPAPSYPSLVTSNQSKDHDSNQSQTTTAQLSPRNP